MGTPTGAGVYHRTTNSGSLGPGTDGPEASAGFRINPLRVLARG